LRCFSKGWHSSRRRKVFGKQLPASVALVRFTLVIYRFVEARSSTALCQLDGGHAMAVVGFVSEKGGVGKTTAFPAAAD
jgi:hypothetical protein